MTEDALKFINDIVKPWETLNVQLGEPYSINPDISAFTNRASSLAISIKHLPEARKKLMSKDLIQESRPYEIISDMADSSKHGELHLTQRECSLTVASMFERNDEGNVRFLRNVINIHHNTYGRIDFITTTLEAALFIAKKLDIKTDWTPKVFNNTGDFSNKIKVHATRRNQIAWTGMQLQFVRLKVDGTYEPVDLNSTVEFTLTSEF